MAGRLPRMGCAASCAGGENSHAPIEDVGVVEGKGAQSVRFGRDSLIDDSMEDDDRNGNPLLHLAVVPSGNGREHTTSKRSRLTLVPLHLDEEDGVSTNLASLPVCATSTPFPSFLVRPPSLPVLVLQDYVPIRVTDASLLRGAACPRNISWEVLSQELMIYLTN